MSTQATAAEIVGRVLRGGAYSNVLLAQLDGRASSADARRVRGLVLDALRTVGLADAALGQASKRPLAKIEHRVLDILRVAIAELHRGTAAPALVIHSAVEVVKETGAARSAGFVNGVLRGVQRNGLPDLDPATTLGVPGWLQAALDEAWGTEEAARFWASSSTPSRVGLRRRADAPADGLTPIPGIAGAYLGDEPRDGFAVQDPASVGVVRALDPQPGERVLDLAAAPGGKTAAIVEAVGEAGLVVGVDVHGRRVRTAAGLVGDALWLQADATRPPFRPGSFDRVLLDAPCSGLGTIRRRPEVVQRVSEPEVARLVGVQERGIEQAMRLVAPGGRLVYSVCTVLPAETTARVAGLDATPPAGLPGRGAGKGWLMAPHLGPTDGMFVAVIDA